MTHKDVSTALSRAPAGLAAPQVRVEVHFGIGLPAFALVGLPEAVVRESRRAGPLRAADHRLRISRRDGSRSICRPPICRRRAADSICQSRSASSRPAENCLRAAHGTRVLRRARAVGGELRETPKLLAVPGGGSAHRREIDPTRANALEAELVAGPRVRTRRPSAASVRRAQGAAAMVAASPDCRSVCPDRNVRGRSRPREVRGQFTAKRALEIAAAGEQGF